MTDRAKTRRQLVGELEDFFYRLIVVPLAAFLPSRLAYGVARLRGKWRYQLDTVMRERIIQNLHLVFGERYSPAERTGLARDFFFRRSCEAIDVMRLSGRGRLLKRLVEIHGLEQVESALASGKGAIICSAHFGAFNEAFSLLGAYGFPVTTVGDWRTTYDSQMSSPKRFLWRLIQENPVAHHRRPNIEPMTDRLGVAMRMVEILRSNELITIAIDDPRAAENRPRAVSVSYLERQVPLLPGIVHIAQLTGSPILVLVMRRQADWRHQVLEISPPLPLTGDAVEDFQQCIKMLEVPIY
ncbi:MAG TPA: hypothetical protein VIZ18_08625, partial [Ktedonobacteraceae bacterium]